MKALVYILAHLALLISMLVWRKPLLRFSADLMLALHKKHPRPHYSRRYISVKKRLNA